MTQTSEDAPLAGKVALVTGGGRGIGRAIALALAQQGADVAVSARRDDEIALVAAAIRALGRRALSVVADVTDAAQVASMRAAIADELGAVDVLINNAGAAGSARFLDHDDALWHQMLAANLTSVYYVSKAFVPAMVERGWGRVVNIASMHARVGGAYVAAYTAAKHGVLGLTRALAVELVAKQITVNAICPGYVDTAMTRGSIQHVSERTGMSEAAARSAFEDLSPQRRLITPDEVAAVAVLLASEAARGITGQAISVDGGKVML
jgi:NAD(P)-dependent dehydrogenase (short-subunit alcohol dehydrogenase family)